MYLGHAYHNSKLYLSAPALSLRRAWRSTPRSSSSRGAILRPPSFNAITAAAAQERERRVIKERKAKAEREAAEKAKAEKLFQLKKKGMLLSELLYCCMDLEMYTKIQVIYLNFRPS